MNPSTRDERRRTRLAILAYRRGRRRLRVALYVMEIAIVASVLAAAVFAAIAVYRAAWVSP